MPQEKRDRVQWSSKNKRCTIKVIYWTHGQYSKSSEGIKLLFRRNRPKILPLCWISYISLSSNAMSGLHTKFDFIGMAYHIWTVCKQARGLRTMEEVDKDALKLQKTGNIQHTVSSVALSSRNWSFGHLCVVLCFTEKSYRNLKQHCHFDLNRQNWTKMTILKNLV